MSEEKTRVPNLAGEVIAETISLLMDHGVHLSEIKQHLKTEADWIDGELAALERCG